MADKKHKEEEEKVEDKKEDKKEDVNKEHDEVTSEPKKHSIDEESKEEETTDTSNIANENIADNIKTEDSTDAVFVKKSSSTSRLFILALFFGLVIGLIIFGGYLLYDSSYNPIKQAEPTPTPQPEPSPTPEPELDLSEYSVQVLNGSGEPGAAGVVGDILVSAGFEDIDTGNADNYDYTDTEVALKPDTQEGVFDAIKESLEEEGFTVVEVTNLSDDDEFDVVVTSGIVGESDQDDSENADTEEEEVTTN